MRRLASLANALRNVPLRPLEGPRSGVRKQLVATAAAGVQREGKRSPFAWLHELRLPRGLASTAIMCTALIAVVGLGLGTSNALPGETLYDMKMRGERVQLALIGSDEDRGRKTLQFASSRLAEVERLATNRQDWPALADTTPAKRSAKITQLINGALSAMDDHTAVGAAAMQEAFEETGDTAPLAYLDEFTEEQEESLNSLLPKLPNGSRPTAAHSIAFVSELHDEAAKLLKATCGKAKSCGSGHTTAASTSADESDDLESTEAGTSDSDDPSTPGDAGESSGSSSQEGSTSASTSDSGSLTSSEPTSGDSSSESSSSSSSEEETPSDSETPSSSSTPSDSDSPSPPQPTGVPSSPSDSSPKSANSAPEEESSTSTSTSSDDSGSTSEESTSAEESPAE